MDHLAGRRARSLRPLQLFLLVNVIFFASAPRVPLFSYSLENYRQFSPPSPSLVHRLVRDAQLRSEARAHVVPGGRTNAAAPWTAERYASAFDARVETLSFVWFTFAGWGMIARATAGLQITRAGATVVYGVLMLLLALSPAYVAVAARRTYGLGPLAAVGLSVLLCAPFVGLLLGYRVLLFVVSYLTV